MTCFHVWSAGFLVLGVLALGHNAAAPDPADHWPPGVVVLCALWPLLLVGFLFVNALEALPRGRR